MLPRYHLVLSYKAQRLLFTFIFVSSLIVGSQIISVQKVNAQSLAGCSPGKQGDHCYAIVTWNGSTRGDSTEVEVTFVTCGTCSGFISNETWMTDSTGHCWIEAGYSTYGPDSDDNHNSCKINQAVNCYFWADYRPSGGGYHEHPLGAIPSSDYGGYELVELYLNPNSYDTCNGVKVSDADWTVIVAGPSNDNWTQLSTCNKFSPYDIEIGEEMENFGANSPATHLIDNFWRDSNNQWQGQSRNISPQSQNPPTAHWNIPPSQNYTGDLIVCPSGC